MFIGSYSLSLDKKNRLTIPAKWKGMVGNEIVISKGYDGCLVIRSIDEFESYCQETLKSDEKRKDNRALRRNTLGNSQLVNLDSWSRFVIPQQFVKSVNLLEEIFLVGVGKCIEIWNYEDYERWMSDENNELEIVSERLSQP